MSSSASSSSSTISSTPPHYFPTAALDHAFAGIVAGAVATVCMNPLDLVKVQFQVDTSPRKKTSKAASSNSSSSLSSSSSSSQQWKSFARKVTGGDVLRDMSQALRNIVKRDGYSGLYRGLSPNVVGNSASWGLYFLWYTMIKEYMAKDMNSNDGKGKKLSAGQHLLAASESGAITALMTNPIWVVKTRMFTTSRSGQSILPPFSPSPSSEMSSISSKTNGSTSSTGIKSGGLSTATTSAPQSTADSGNYRGLLQSLRHIWKHEGLVGMYKGAGLALVGVSNGAIQFVCYEELKRWRMTVAKNKQSNNYITTSTAATTTSKGQSKFSDEDVKLDNAEYIVMSGVAKLAAIGLTYPYQVIRSRIQNHNTTHIYPNIPTCIRLTWKNEGFRGFYKGMAANAIRILPGTCVTFVVYENCSWALRGLAERKADQRRVLEQGDTSLSS